MSAAPLVIWRLPVPVALIARTPIIRKFIYLAKDKVVPGLDIVFVSTGMTNVEKPESEYRPTDILVSLSLLIST